MLFYINCCAILIPEILFWLFIGSSFVQLLYWTFIFSKLAFYKEKFILSSKSSPPISIIICGKNEGINFQKNLPSILEQHYHEFEVIVVNDGSTDNSEDVLNYFKNTYSNLHIINISQKEKGNRSGKKYALSKGITSAQYAHVLLTDADCAAGSNQWIKAMAQHLKNNKEIVLGYSPYHTKTGWLNQWIRFEAIYTALQYFSFALWGKTYMGVGRNLLYKKSLFTQNKGFERHEHIASGDDDLFINEVANTSNVAVCIHPSSFMYSEPKVNFKAYFQQKSRHLTTGMHYHLEHKFYLGLQSLSHFLHYILILLLILLKFRLNIVLSIAILLFLVKCFFYGKILKKLEDTTLFYYLAFLDIGLLVYAIIFTPALLIGKTNKWT